jgi:hypothetical protein
MAFPYKKENNCNAKIEIMQHAELHINSKEQNTY